MKNPTLQNWSNGGAGGKELCRARAKEKRCGILLKDALIKGSQSENENVMMQVGDQKCKTTVKITVKQRHALSERALTLNIDDVHVHIHTHFYWTYTIALFKRLKKK